MYAMTNDTFVDFLMFMNHFFIIFSLFVSADNAKGSSKQRILHKRNCRIASSAAPNTSFKIFYSFSLLFFNFFFSLIFLFIFCFYGYNSHDSYIWQIYIWPVCSDCGHSPSLASLRFLGLPQRSSMMRLRSAALRSCSFFNSSAAFLRSNN